MAETGAWKSESGLESKSWLWIMGDNLGQSTLDSVGLPEHCLNNVAHSESAVGGNGDYSQIGH